MPFTEQDYELWNELNGWEDRWYVSGLVVMDEETAWRLRLEECDRECA